MSKRSAALVKQLCDKFSDSSAKPEGNRSLLVSVSIHLRFGTVACLETCDSFHPNPSAFAESVHRSRGS